jgi:hypothetical protein
MESTSANWQNHPNNKPDIIISGNEKGACMLTDVAIPGDRNGIKKEAEKILNNKDITIKLHDVECKNKSDTSNNRANVTISESSRKYLKQRFWKA